MDDSNNIPSKGQKVSIWVDLPQDILVSIHNKLYWFDQVGFRTVCKNWHIPKELIRCRGPCGRLPWLLTRYSWTNSRPKNKNRYPFDCEIFDPYSQKTYKVSTCIESCENLNGPYNESTTRLYASKYGWSLFGVTRNESLIFLHNPFTNGVIQLPYLSFICKAATFTTNPTSGDSEVFALCRHKEEQHTLYVARFCLFKNKEWSVKFAGSMLDKPDQVCYMNGELYCYFFRGSIKSYNLTKESWKSIAIIPNSYDGSRCWLIANNKSLIVVQEKRFMWLVFTIDWSTISRSLVPRCNSRHNFPGNIVLLATRDDGEGDFIIKAYKNINEIVADEEHNGCKIKCHFLGLTRQQVEDDNSRRIHGLSYTSSFMEPPYDEK